MIRPQPTSTLFPYTTLFRSQSSRPVGTRSRCGGGSPQAPASNGWLRSPRGARSGGRSEEHTSELQSHSDLVCRLLLEKKKICCPKSIHRAIRGGGRVHNANC